MSHAAGAMAAPMLLASVMPRSTTRPIVAARRRTRENCAPAPASAESSAQPAPVTVCCAVSGAVAPISSGRRYCRSAEEKWLDATHAALAA